MVLARQCHKQDRQETHPYFAVVAEQVADIYQHVIYGNKAAMSKEY